MRRLGDPGAYYNFQKSASEPVVRYDSSMTRDARTEAIFTTADDQMQALGFPPLCQSCYRGDRARRSPESVATKSVRAYA